LYTHRLIYDTSIFKEIGNKKVNRLQCGDSVIDDISKLCN